MDERIRIKGHLLISVNWEEVMSDEEFENMTEEERDEFNEGLAKMSVKFGAFIQKLSNKYNIAIEYDDQYGPSRCTFSCRFY